MTPKQALQAGLSRKLLDRKGRAVAVTVRPGLAEPELEAFASKLRRGLPPEIRELLAFASGLEFDDGWRRVGVDVVDFVGRITGSPIGNLPRSRVDPELAGPLELAFANAFPIAADGSGNFWVVDVDPQSGAWGTVFYLCHDPCEVVHQATSIAGFLEQVLQSGKRDEGRLISRCRPTTHRFKGTASWPRSRPSSTGAFESPTCARRKSAAASPTKRTAT